MMETDTAQSEMPSKETVERFGRIDVCRLTRGAESRAAAEATQDGESKVSWSNLYGAMKLPPGYTHYEEAGGRSESADQFCRRRFGNPGLSIYHAAKGGLDREFQRSRWKEQSHVGIKVDFC